MKRLELGDLGAGDAQAKKYKAYSGFPNLVPRACDPWEGNEGSGIIRCRKPGIMAKIELRIHFNGQSDSSLKRIIPEPSFPSRGSQARGTRLWISQQQGQNCPETALVVKWPIIAFSNRIICNLTANLNRYRYNKLIYSINLPFLFVYTFRKSGFLS
jgi:hypothetical protein